MRGNCSFCWYWSLFISTV